ncbi:ras-GEF domain-containing family member 1B-like isoform X2 [Anopheles albimanus]|uniref:ras-GEF domain-containing family member 1B-like isoform X2 n=1 Tax=Anopheles albimanus TaxID=7167 RepID=UPI0016420F21|nr:ras-GEF domain-containing family member 1B-like isoform X2 [Anopheles albimanus]
MNSTTAPSTLTSSTVLPKKPPVPIKPRTIPPPANPMSASTAQNTPKITNRTSMLAQRLEETLRLGIELENAQLSRHPKINSQNENISNPDAVDKSKQQTTDEHKLQSALQAEMRRQCGSIKARFLLERRLPQNGSNLKGKEQSPFESNLAKTDDLLLHYTEGNLMSGSLDGLLTHFTPSGTYFPDKSFMFTFLLAARQFLRPDEILDKVILSTQSNGGATNVPRLLAAWMHDFPYDFRDERMMRIVRSFTEQSTENDRKCQRERNTLSRALRRLANRLTKLEKYELDKTLLQQLKFNGDEWRNAQPLVELASGSPVLMANTLTTIEAERFSFIALEEFFPAPYSSTSCRMGVSNLLAYVQWYNRLTYVVATDILRSPRKRHRARAVEFWIETGRECFNRGNFNSLMAIIATLTGGPIGRLKKTWSKVTSSSSSLLSGMTSSSMISAAGGMGGNSSSCSSAAGGGRQQLAILEHQADPTNNFATYRATLQAAAWRSIPSSSRSSSTSSSQSSKNHSSCSSDDAHSKKESTIAVLPFFSLLLKDLHFLNETSGNSILPNGHINYDKWRQLGERLLEIRRWQRRSSYQRRCRLGRRHKSVTAEVALLRESIERGPIIGDKETNSLEATKHIREQVDSTTCVDDSERGAAALAKVSYEREAPEGAVEKAHWKSLQQYST